MGDVADMMLDGTLCAGCGVYIGKNNGFPEFCKPCGKEVKTGTFPLPKKVKAAPKGIKVQCPHCNRKAKEGQGLADHIRIMHGEG